jgi:hypothetical protein
MKKIVKIIKEVYQDEKDGVNRVYNYGVYQITNTPDVIGKNIRKFGDGKFGKLIHTSPTIESAKKFAKNRRSVRTESEKKLHKTTYRVAKL